MAGLRGYCWVCDRTLEVTPKVCGMFTCICGSQFAGEGALYEHVTAENRTPPWRGPRPRVSRVWAYDEFRWVVQCGGVRRVIGDWAAAVDYANHWAQIIREEQVAA